MVTSRPRRDWVPSACTLPTREQPLRVAEFDALVTSSLRAVIVIEATAIELVLADSEEVAAAARDLTRREAVCCSFFRFSVEHSVGAPVTVLIGVDAAHVDALAGLAARAGALLAERAAAVR